MRHTTDKNAQTYITELTPEMLAGPWTCFSDRHSGGGTNTAYEKIFIQAPEHEAEAVFCARFDQSPRSTNCSCCGSNYSIYEDDDIYGLTGFYRELEPRPTAEGGGYYEDRGRDYTRYGGKVQRPIPLLEYANRPDVAFIFASDIKPEEREAWNIMEPSYPYDYDTDYEEDD